MAISVFKSVAIVVYTQYATGQPVSNLATVLNRLSSGHHKLRRQMKSEQQLVGGEARTGGNEHQLDHYTSAAAVLRRLASDAGEGSSSQGGADSPPIDFSNTGTLSVITLLAQQDMGSRASTLSSSTSSSTPVAYLASDTSSTGSSSTSPSAYLPTSIQSAGVDSIAMTSSLLSATASTSDLGSLLQTAIVAQVLI